MALYTQADVDAMLSSLATFKAALLKNPEANPGWLEKLDGAEDKINALLGTEKPPAPPPPLEGRIIDAKQELIDAKASGDAVRYGAARIALLELRLERAGVRE